MLGMSVFLLVNLALFIIFILIGSVVFIHDSISPLNKNFFGFSVFISIWLLSNYFSNDFGISYRLALGFNHVVLFSSGLALLFLANFTLSLTTKKKLAFPVGLSKLLSTPGLVVSLSPLVITSIVKQDRVYAIEFGGLAGLYIFSMILVTATLFYGLYKGLKESTGEEKLRTKIITWGFGVSITISVLFNLIIPFATGYFGLTRFGPLASVILFGSMTYVITRHHLFDIRGLVYRSLIYVFSLTVIGLSFALASNYWSTLVFDTRQSKEQIVFSTVLTLLFAVLFQPFKIFFSKATKRFFFKESYDTQKVLDDTSSFLATEIDLKKIVERCLLIITNNLKITHARFTVFKDGETYLDIANGIKIKRALLRSDIDQIEGILIQRQFSHGQTRKFLNLYDADILVKLRTNEETVGAILLGPKQSGTAYTKQDIDLLTIIEKELAIAVQNSRYFEQIQEFNIKLQKEVSDATAELRMTNAKLKALDEAKDEFVSMASHQLRTPLTSVKGYLSMVLEGDAGKVPKEQKKLLKEAFASSQRMVYLIADLLNVSRLRTGKFVIEPSEVYLPDLIAQEISQLEPIASARRLKIQYDQPKNFKTVWLDDTKIRQVVMNYIDNAIYYTPSGGKITIKLVQKKSSIEFTVSDTGIGVAKDQQASLFTKFFRADNARKARPDGTGIGLYMAQRVISAQGGSVIFKSELGKGSTFGFSFPLRTVATKRSVQARTVALPAQAERLE
jgi:signal transduction histidine kinase